MPKRIEDLVADIYKYLSRPYVSNASSNRGTPSSDTGSSCSCSILMECKPCSDHKQRIKVFGNKLGECITARLKPQAPRTELSLSQLGQPDRKLWFTYNHPEAAEPLRPETRLKFLYGDILEELLLFLAEETGHTVEGRQTELEINGIKGHRDAVIDGRLVDVKSASSYSFSKFESNGLRENDPFGYLRQIGAYSKASERDVVVTERGVNSFLVVDKTLGYLCLDTYPTDEVDYPALVEHKKTMLKGPIPDRCFSDVPEGKSGNHKLSVGCSYCPFKKKCWPGLRTFIYSTGPIYLTEVVRLPKVAEIVDNDNEGVVCEPEVSK